LVNHWSEERLDDGNPEDTLVRPYTITRDRILPERSDLSLITPVTTLDARIEPGAARPPSALAAGQQSDIRLLQAVRDGLFRL
jgi:hypothetical protein